MTHRHPLIAILCSMTLLATACGGDSETDDEASISEAQPIAGMYEVAGTTIEGATGNKREIARAALTIPRLQRGIGERTIKHVQLVGDRVVNIVA